MTTQEYIRDYVGMTAFDKDGSKIGTVGQVYYDDKTDRPSWVTVNTGLFGTNESFVPLAGARPDGDRLVLAHDKSRVKDAPNIGTDQHLSEKEEAELYRYYGVSDSESTRGEVRDAGRARTGDQAMTRSEERLNVGTQREQTGKVRLRKHVVTENQQVQVPVSHEEVRLEREPITEANRDRIGRADISEDEQEVTLHRERPVVGKETVPVERVRLGKETVAETETVKGQVRKEQIEVDETGTPRKPRT